MSSFINSFLLVYAGLFPIVDPVGGAPIFLGLTRWLKTVERDKLALRVAVNGFLLLLGSLVIGSYVLEFFGITLPVVRVAGGLVVATFGWKLLHENEELHDRSDADAAAREDRPIDAFYPLTMPLTVGPGSISVAVTLGSQRPHGVPTLTDALAIAGGLAGLVAVAATIFLCYRYAERLTRALGESGTNVLTRLSAFILLCIGIQIIWNGAEVLLHP
jgi:multiple antibiotic resistance protein